MGEAPGRALVAVSAGDRAAIDTESLVRDFGQVRAVDGVDLRIPAGEIYGFLGPNGPWGPARLEFDRRPGAPGRPSGHIGGHPPAFIALFFFVVNIATLKKITSAQARVRPGAARPVGP